MKIELNITQILVYYDLPELFLAEDIIGTKYISMLVEVNNKTIKYIATPISLKKLTNFINGNIDLRDIFKQPETKEWYTINEIEEEKIIAEKYNDKILPEIYLPIEGYFHAKTNHNDELIKAEMLERANAIIHLSIAEKNGNGSIEANNLSDYVKLYQSFLLYTYKKAIIEHNVPDKKEYLKPHNYTLRAFAATTGSLNLHFYSTSNKDLFGECYIELALNKLDEIISNPDERDEYIRKLRTVKGHAISTYQKILNKIIADEVILKYKWITPNRITANTREINKEYAEKVNEILKLVEDIKEETKIFIGFVQEVDYGKGNWRILNEDDKKEYSGKAGQDLLKGITIETIKYKFICQEFIEELTVAEKEKVRYELKNIEIVN